MGWFTAAYAGVCTECDEPFEVGQPIEKHGQGYAHATHEAGLSRLDLAPDEVVCTDCFLVKPCGCDDGQGPKS